MLKKTTKYMISESRPRRLADYNARVAWYKEWFGEEYLELYAHRDSAEAELHVDFVESEVFAGLRPGRILDLACGGGRHAAVLGRRGHAVVGVDLSLVLLAQGARLPRVAGDMRNLPFAAGSFGAVLNFFTSFGYFETERENFRVLEEVVRVLAPGGRFLLDLMNPAPVIANLEPRQVVETDGRHIEIERWYDETAKRINKRIRIRPAHGPERSFLESVRAYREDEVTTGLEWAGLEVTRRFGSFSGDAYRRDSDRLILVGHKPR